jgi:hypothetical protein
MDEAAAAAPLVVLVDTVVLVTDEVCAPMVVDGNVVSGLEMIEEDLAVEMIGEESSEAVVVVAAEADTDVDETYNHCHDVYVLSQLCS